MTEVIMLPEEYQQLILMNNQIENTELAIQTLKDAIIEARLNRRKLLDKTRHRNRYYNGGGKEKKRQYYLKKKMEENPDLIILD